MKTVYFVRHGQSEANVQLVFGGDTGLTQLGREQALVAAQSIADMPNEVDKIICSDMVRAKETAKIIADHIGYPVSEMTYDARINEVDVGELAGVEETLENLKIREGIILKSSGEMNIETLDHLVARIEAFVADLRDMSADTILVVGHGQSGRMLCRVLNDMERTKPLPVPPNAYAAEIYPNFTVKYEGRLVL